MPRSRGVYRRLRPAAMTCWGSSPLARGLLPAARPDRGACRIIPARAGFTQRISTRSIRGRDHPRSRGVYNDMIENEGDVPGSSPLARGLRRHSHRRRRRPGIIPARAGFTSCGRWWGVRGRDHPRSRGVYGVASALMRSASGSSPLARGLPVDHARVCHQPGIIPARAGFT